MSYRVGIAPAAKREIKKLAKKAPAADFKAIVDAIDSLGANPRPDGVEKLSGAEGIYRVRRGNFRIIYQVQDGKLLVVVVKVANRKEAYQGIIQEAVKRAIAYAESRGANL